MKTEKAFRQKILELEAQLTVARVHESSLETKLVIAAEAGRKAVTRAEDAERALVKSSRDITAACRKLLELLTATSERKGV